MKLLLLFFRVRRAQLIFCLITCLTALSGFYVQPIIVMQTDLFRYPRSIFMAEISTILIASLVPSLMGSRFGARELKMAPMRRRLSVAYAIFIYGMATLPFFWHWVRLKVTYGEVFSVPISHVWGGGFTYVTIGVICYLILGDLYGTVLAVLLSCSLPVVQHFYPGSPLDLLVAASPTRGPDVKTIYLCVAIWIALSWWRGPVSFARSLHRNEKRN